MNHWINNFTNYFKVKIADTPKLIEQALHLRYEIYCLEKGYEDPDKFENELEQDILDCESVHGLLLFIPNDALVGTVRLILPDATNQNRLFPIEQHSKFISTKKEYKQGHSILGMVDRKKIAEVSRFSISKAFRKRLGEAKSTHGLVDNEDVALRLKDRRLIPHLTVGLIRAIFQLSHENGIDHWFAVMEPTLRNSVIKRYYLEFHPLGPAVDYHGVRQPYIVNIASAANGIRIKDKLLWGFLTNNGQFLS